MSVSVVAVVSVTLRDVQFDRDCWIPRTSLAVRLSIPYHMIRIGHKKNYHVFVLVFVFVLFVLCLCSIFSILSINTVVLMVRALINSNKVRLTPKKYGEYLTNLYSSFVAIQ